MHSGNAHILLIAAGLVFTVAGFWTPSEWSFVTLGLFGLGLVLAPIALAASATVDDKTRP